MSSGMTEVVQKAICQKLLITLPPLPRLPFRGLLLVGLIHSQKLSLVQNSVNVSKKCIIWKLFQLHNMHYPTVIAKAINPK